MSDDLQHDELWLKEMLTEEPLAEDGFSRTVMVQLTRRRRRQRVVRGLVWLGLVIAAVSVGIALSSLDPSSFSLAEALLPTTQTLETHHILALALLSLGLGSALWLDTEAFGPGV